MRAVGRLAGLAFAGSVAIAMAVNPGRPLEPILATADAIPIPATWERLGETRRDDRGPMGCDIMAFECPNVTRHYAVTDEGPLAAPIGDRLRTSLVAAGLETTGGFPDPCPRRQLGDGCYFTMRRGSVMVRISILAPAEISTSSGGLPGRVSVAITVSVP